MAGAAAAEAAVATVSVPATAAIVSLFRVRVMIRRSSDKVILQPVTRGQARLAARLPSPCGAGAATGGGAIARGRGAGQGTGPHGAASSSRALTTTHHAV